MQAWLPGADKELQSVQGKEVAPEPGVRGGAPVTQVLRMTGLDMTLPLIDERLEQWRGTLRTLRSSEARAAFSALRPALREALAAAPEPERALVRLETVIERVPTAINLFRLFEARPGLLDLVLRVVTLAQTLADELDVTADSAAGINRINDDEGVRWLYSFLSADKRRTYCLYEAPSADAIRRAAERAGLPADVIVEVTARVEADGSLTGV